MYYQSRHPMYPLIIHLILFVSIYFALDVNTSISYRYNNIKCDKHSREYSGI